MILYEIRDNQKQKDEEKRRLSLAFFKDVYDNFACAGGLSDSREVYL